MAEIDKGTVNYGPGRQNYRCGVCPNYRVPNTCILVSGEIEPDGVCDFYGRDPKTVDDVRR